MSIETKIGLLDLNKGKRLPGFIYNVTSILKNH